MRDLVLIFLICGLLTLAVMWDKAIQRRNQESPIFDEDDDLLLIQPKYEEKGVPMPHLYVEGSNGQIEVDDEWVRITARASWDI